MKTVITILLIACLLAPIPANCEPSTEAAAPAGLALLLLGFAAVGIYAVITISSTLPSDDQEVTLTLQKSNDHSTWQEVCQKTVRLNGTNAVEFFREEMTDDVAFYRVKKAN